MIRGRNRPIWQIRYDRLYCQNDMLWGYYQENAFVGDVTNSHYMTGTDGTAAYIIMLIVRPPHLTPEYILRIIWLQEKRTHLCCH